MKILICGAGAIGSNLVRNLVPDLKGEHEITVVDFDVVEERNVTPGTQWYTAEQIGLPKVEALQYNVYQAFQREIIAERANVIEIDPDEYDLVVDCFDNFHARNVLHEIKTEVVHVGFSDQFTFEIEWDEHYQVPTDITSGMDICEMPGAAGFVSSVASLASLVVERYVREKQQMRVLGGKYTRSIVT